MLLRLLQLPFPRRLPIGERYLQCEPTWIVVVAAAFAVVVGIV